MTYGATKTYYQLFTWLSQVLQCSFGYAASIQEDIPCHKRSSQPSRRARWCRRCAGAFWSRCGAHWLRRWQSWLSQLKILWVHTWPPWYEAFPRHCGGKKKIIQTIGLSYAHTSWSIINQKYSWGRYCSLLCFVWTAVKTNEPIYWDVPELFENCLKRVAHF